MAIKGPPLCGILSVKSALEENGSIYGRDAQPAARIRPPNIIRPSDQAKKYKKLLLNDEDVMNEFKLHELNINNFATY